VNVIKLALRSIKGNPIKSLTIFFCVFGVAAFFVSVTLIMAGAQSSIDSGLKRLGADILVMPVGAENKVETALLMGKPTKVWMSGSFLDQVANVEGVGKASPQLYLQSLFNAHCCSVSEMFMVVFDPGTDFTITPWLNQNLGRGLTKGEVIGGTYVFLPEGEKYIRLYGYDLDLKGKLEATGMGLDQTMFMTLETASDLANSSISTAVSPLEIPENKISSILVRVAEGYDPHGVALSIEKNVSGVVAVESPNLFGSFRKQILGLLSGLAIITSLAWVMCGIIIGLVFSMSTHERRREIAVMRAMGFTRFYVFRAIWVEAALLAAAAALAGIVLSSLGIYYFHNFIAGTLGMPFLFPSGSAFLMTLLSAFLIAVLMVSLAVFIPAYRISRHEPAVEMRE
jgi:putative ABC transport system permease protein